MPNIKEQLVVPVAIPAWGVLSAIVMGAFAWGALYNQLNELIKGREKLELVYERQIKNIEMVNRHDEELRKQGAKLDDLGARVIVLERAVDVKK